MKKISFVLTLVLCVSFWCCQKVIPTELSVSPTELSFDKNGGEKTISISANKTWMASSSAEWCKVSTLKGEATQNKLSISCASNSSYDERTCTVTISSEEISKTIKITQDTNEELLISKSLYELSNEAQTVEIEVNTNIEFTVSISDDCKEWISLISIKALSQNKASFYIAANETYDNREGKITFTQKNGALKSIVTIKQGQTSGLFVEQKSYDVSFEAQTVEIKVKSNVDYAVTVDESSKAWLSVIETKALSESVIILNISQNDNEKARNGKVLLVSDELQEEITIKQNGGTYVIFEDKNFEDYCVEHFDFDNDGRISFKEAKDVTKIDCGYYEIGGYRYYRNIKSLKPLGVFVNLKELRITNPNGSKYDMGVPNEIKEIDISKNTSLVSLECNNNQLTTLDVSNNRDLEKLVCYKNQIRSIDVSNNPKLQELLCVYNQIETIDVSNCIALRRLQCSNNNLKIVDVTKNTELIDLECGANSLTNLDVSNNTSLQTLDCCYNNLTSLDVSNNPSLQTLACYNNQLTNLDLSNNTNLVTLWCEYNKLTTLDLGKNSKLSTLKCNNNLLTSLDVSELTGVLNRLNCINNPYLTEIWLMENQTIKDFSYDTSIATIKYKSSGAETDFVEFEDNVFKQYCINNFDLNKDGKISLTEASVVYSISCSGNIASFKGIEFFVNLKVLYYWGSSNHPRTRLDISKNTQLEILYCRDTQLENLDISKNSQLKELSIWDVQLKSIDITNNTRLEALVIYNEYQLASLDISNNNLLKILHINNTKLPNLDVTNNTQLEELRIIGVSLSNLDVSNNSKLRIFECGNNQLTSLNLRNNTVLEYLSCPYNQLSNIDISNNTRLSRMMCYNNHLTTLDVSKNIQLVTLRCDNNQLTAVDFSDNRELQYLDCSNNQLTALDISSNRELQYLYCSNNQLTALDFSANPLIQYINCSDNLLTNLNVSDNLYLTELDCSNNKLTTLDVSSNTYLASLICKGNLLTILDVSKNPQLRTLDCTNNPYLTEIWLKTNTTMYKLLYDTDIATIKYKD